MQLARLSLFLLVSCASASKLQPARSNSSATASSNSDVAHSELAKPAEAQPLSAAASASAPISTVDLTRERTLVNESEAARKASDYVTARAKIAEAVTSLLARPDAEQDETWLELLNAAGQSARSAEGMQTASSAWQRVLEVRSRTLPDDHSELQLARQNLAETLARLGDLAGARTLLEKVLAACSRTLPDDHPDLQKARWNLAATIHQLGDFAGARALFEKVLEVRLRTLPDDHPDLQTARWAFAVAIKSLGDLAGARALEEKVLEVRSRTLPEDHPDLQLARGNLATTLKMLGDLAGARALQEKVLEVNARTFPDDHSTVQAARQGLASTIKALGDLAGARALEEKVLEVRLRTVSADHPDLQSARGNLANTLARLGDLAGARTLQEQVLEVRLRTLPDDHPDLQVTRLNLASTIKDQGEVVEARALEEKVVEVFSRTLPDEHPSLLAARQGLAVTLTESGDFARARALEEKVLEVRSRTLPDDHPDLQAARGNLALTIKELGDLSGARALEEKVLEVRSRTLPEDHPDLQMARQNLAMTMHLVGDLSGARELGEKVLAVRSRTLPDEHPDLQAVRQNLAVTMQALGDLAGARLLKEKVLEVNSRTLGDDHPNLQGARQNLAAAIKALGDLSAARALFEKVLEVNSRTLPEGHPDLQAARANVAETIASQCARAGRTSGAQDESTEERERGRARCAELLGALCRAQVRAAREAIVGSPGREAEERCSTLARRLDQPLSFAGGYGVFEPLRELEAESFVFSETMRAAAIVAAELTRRAADSPKYGELRDALSEASDELAVLAHKGTTSAEFDRARTKREAVERELGALALALSGGTHSGVELDVESLAAGLEAREAAVAFRQFKKTRMNVSEELDSTGQPAVRVVSEDSLCAFVVRSTNDGAQQPPTLTFVDLGSIAPIADSVRAWRDGLGIGSGSRGVGTGTREASTGAAVVPGIALREKIFDPLLPALAGAQRIVFALDDMLNLVPLDALPLGDVALLGDRWQIETRTTLTELLQSPEPLEPSGQLVAFGDVEYGTGGIPEPDQVVAAAVTSRAAKDAGILRGSAWSEGFSPLPGTGVEVRGIVRSFRDQIGPEAAPELCEHARATREKLLELAPRARWLHIATHGWFAPESIPSWNDPEPLDKRSGLGMRVSGQEQVRGMSPMLLCGLALAGANLPETATGRVPGLVTADELSTLDLTNCELVVLSACDTNAGERRAGQGVASLQKALQMAGARSVITSLWKVPDEATKELMLDFYRRLWVEKKPKWQALWEAKKKLREAKDESGALKYTTRDWAAWVLTGEPR